MTTWYLLFERRVGSKSWTLTYGGNEGGLNLTKFAVKHNAETAQRKRREVDAGWETTIVKVEIPT